MTAKPSAILLAVLVLSVSVFLLGGGIYDIVEQPIVAFVSAGKIIPFYPQVLNEQLLGESVASMVLYSFGIVGLILIYRSTKFAYNPKEALTTLLIGLALIVIAWMLIEFFLFPGTVKPLQ